MGNNVIHNSCSLMYLSKEMNKKNEKRILALKKDMHEVFSKLPIFTSNNFENCKICLLKDECKPKLAHFLATIRTTEIMNITESCPFVATWIERVLFPNQFNYVMGNKFMTIFKKTTDDDVVLLQNSLLLTSEGELIYPAWNSYYILIPPSFREFFITTIIQVSPELNQKIKHWSIEKRRIHFEKHVNSKKNGQNISF